MDTIESTTDHVKDRQKPGCCERSSQMGIARRGSRPRTAPGSTGGRFSGVIPETTPNPKNAVNRLLRGKGRAEKSRKSGFRASGWIPKRFPLIHPSRQGPGIPPESAGFRAIKHHRGNTGREEKPAPGGEMIITAERGQDRICTRCRGDVLVDGDGEARCWQCGREPGWDRRPPPPRLDPLARGAPAPKPSPESARADFEYWATLLAAARLDLARPDVILPDPDGDATPDADNEQDLEPSQTVEIRAATNPAAVAAVNPGNASVSNNVNRGNNMNSVNVVNLNNAVNPDETELAAATSGQPEEPSGIPRQQGADSTAIPANSPFTGSGQFNWLAWQEAFRLAPDTAPAVSRKAKMSRPGKPPQPRPQGPHEVPPGRPGATCQQGRLLLKWQ